jgi:hypothetical protein
MCQIRSSARVWLCLSVLLTSGGLTAAQNPPSLDDVAAGLARTKILLLDQPSFEIVCAREKSEELGPNGGLLTAEWLMAHKGDKWLIQQRFLKPFNTEKLVVPGEPKVYVANAQKMVDWDQFSRQCVVDHFGDGRNIYNGWYYFQNLGINVYPYIVKSGGGNYEDIRRNKGSDLNMDFPFLPEFLQENLAKYMIHAKQESVDGFPCWVVEWAGMDRMLVDVTHGFAIRHRTYYWGPGKPLRLDISSGDFREVKPGLWLPYIQRVEKYVDVRYVPESLWGKLDNRSVYATKKIELGNIPDSLFDVQIPAGTMVTDLIRHVQYRVSEANADPFDGSIEKALSLLHKGDKGREATLAVCLILLAMLTTVFIIRIRRKLSQAHRA